MVWLIEITVEFVDCDHFGVHIFFVYYVVFLYCYLNVKRRSQSVGNTPKTTIVPFIFDKECFGYFLC